jgi:calnexin
LTSKKDGSDRENDEERLAYRGEWAFEEPEVWKGIDGDVALVVKTPAAHHAISAKFDEVIDPKAKGMKYIKTKESRLVVQCEVKFQKQHDCGK